MEPFTEHRPWGDFRQFCLNEKTTVKIISVKKNEKLSLQYHNKREEFWKIIQGEAKILIGDKVHKAKEGQEFFIPIKTKHRIMTENSEAKILEISFGEFDENDIVRLKDKYNRSTH